MSPRRSLLAGVNALYRMAESARPAADRVLDDPWAGDLIERSLRVRAIRFGRFVVPGLRALIDELQTTHCVRHRAIDELILRWIDGTRASPGASGAQVVVLGAGYDMRPYRFASRLRGVRWIEIDHPATQGRKLELLAHARVTGLTPERTPGDLAAMSLESILARSSFESSAPTLFVAEGVIHYLPEAAIRELAATIAKLGGAFVFSYIDRAVYAAASPALIALVRAVRELPLVSFDRPSLEKLCREAGFTRVDTWSLAEQIRDFAPQAAQRRQGAAQHVALATRTGFGLTPA